MNQRAQHEVKQKEELVVENETARVDEAIVNVEGTDVATTKERCQTSEYRGKPSAKKIKGNF